MIWCRSDWDTPVGRFKRIDHELVRSSLKDQRLTEFEWVRVEVERLYLSHRAALLMLQGIKISDLLIPNNFIKYRVDLPAEPKAHLVLASRPMELGSPPCLDSLVLADLHGLPEGLDPEAVLEALVQDTLGRSASS